MSPAQQESYEAGLQVENALIDELKLVGLSQNQSLQLLGISKGSYHYRENPRPRVAEPVSHTQRASPMRLSPEEVSRVATLLEESTKSVSETFYDHWDAGEYVASLSTFYRVARREGIPMAATGPARRRRQAVAPVRKAPVVCATAPGQVACWDITFLPGTFKNMHFALYVIIDLFSRMIIGWTVQHREDSKAAAELMLKTLQASTETVVTVHSDNGGAMTSALMVETLTACDVEQSLIRPGVSNDNAQIEALFRTVKYGPEYPGEFDSIEDVRAWFAVFVDAYNNEHHHTKLAGFTPSQVYDGSWLDVAQRRQATLEAHCAARPGRYRQEPVVRVRPDRVGLNLGHDEGKTHTPPTLVELLAG